MESGFCWGAAILIFIILVIYSGHSQKKQEERKQAAKKQEAAPFVNRSIDIIQESMDIINKTKNLDIVVGRFETIFTQVDQLAKLVEQYQFLDLVKPSPQEMKEFYSKKRNEFIRDFVIKQADDDIGRAKAVTRNSSKIASLDKALLRLFDGKKALNNDDSLSDFETKEKEIHQMIDDINESKNAQGG